MHRQIIYSDQIPLDTDQLLQSKNTMIGLGFALKAILGTSTVFDGLACTPNSPAALNVLVAGGSVYSLQNVDGTAYGSLAPDTTNQIVKQGIIQTTTTLATPAPGTTGQSINYLIQAAYQDVDSGSTVLPYYNASNPAVAWNGPNNTGVSQNTVRQGVCLLGVKAGTAATTGTQTTPAPDAGYTGLYTVTVANGQTTVTSGNINQLATAPFIATKLPAILTAIQQDTVNYALDTSGSANTITVTLSPAPAALTDGLVVRVKVANSSTGATVINVNGLGNVACNTTSGAAFAANTVVANGIYAFVYDANGTRFQLQGFTAASATGLIPANNLSDVSNVATSRTNLGLGSAALLASTAVCKTANNLSDVANAATALINLGAVGSVNIQAITSSGNYTPSANMLYCIVEAVGGGGGGGGSGGSYSSGGGGGEYRKGKFSAATIGASQSVTIGAAGSAGVSGNGTAGGNTSFGALITANGGSGGTGGASSGGVGGSGGSGGIEIIPGQQGGYSSAGALVAGGGGNSMKGFGGPMINGTNAGVAGVGYGAGGSGASASSTGGAGTAGVVIITEFIA